LFVKRSHVELDLLNQNDIGHGGPKTPEMCEQEMWVHMLAYNLIRLLMAQAAATTKVLPRQLSFKHTLQIWVAWSQRQFLSDAKEDVAALFNAHRAGAGARR
jgi:hypothetical protein